MVCQGWRWWEFLPWNISFSLQPTTDKMTGNLGGKKSNLGWFVTTSLITSLSVFGQKPSMLCWWEPEWDSRVLLTMSSSHVSRHRNDPVYQEVWKASVWMQVVLCCDGSREWEFRLLPDSVCIITKSWMRSDHERTKTADGRGWFASWFLSGLSNSRLLLAVSSSCLLTAPKVLWNWWG